LWPFTLFSGPVQPFLPLYADIYVPIRHLYNCRASSTNQPFYAKQSQFSPFFGPKTRFCPKTNPIQTQNKANSKPIYRTTEMSVYPTLTRVYERNGIFAARKTKPKQSQFKANSKPIYRTAKMSVSSTLTTVYERNGIFAARKTKPKQSQFAGVLKMKVSSALTRSYGDMAALMVRQNKPKQSQFRYLLCRSCQVLFDDAELAARWVDKRLRLLWQGRTKKLPDALERLKNPPAIMNHTPCALLYCFVLDRQSPPGKVIDVLTAAGVAAAAVSRVS